MTVNIFGKEVPLYGICFFIGIFFAAVVGFLLIKKRNIDAFDFLCVAVYIMIGAIVGAKLLFLLVSIDTIIEYNLSLVEVIKGGFVFYGGLLGGILALFIYGKQFKTKMGDYVDICATVLPLGHAFGGVGCHFGGCCYGMPYDGIGHIIYHPDNVSSPLTPVNTPLLPIQLIETFCLLCLFVIMLVVFLKFKKKTWLCTMVYILAKPLFVLFWNFSVATRNAEDF